MSVKVEATAKHTVHTDALDTLGHILNNFKVGRDAIHLAVEPVIAGEKLYAGQDIGRLPDGRFGIKGCDKYLGVVDPFGGAVQPGDKFWLFVYPRQITSLNHVWQHPDFPEKTHDEAEVEPLYTVMLMDSGPNKINTIKSLRGLLGIGLKVAKDLTDNTPCIVAEGRTHEEAEEFVKVLNGVAWAKYHLVGQHVNLNPTSNPILTVKTQEIIPSFHDTDEDDDFNCSC